MPKNNRSKRDKQLAREKQTQERREQNRKTKTAVIAERLTWINNERKYGTQSSDVIHNAFIKRARQKIYRDISISILLPFAVVMTVGLLAFFSPELPLLQKLSSRFDLSIIGYLVGGGFLPAMIILSRVLLKRNIKKYWSCPHCGKELPVGRTLLRAFVVVSVYLVPNGDQASCPYCGAPFPERAAGRSSR